MIAELTREVRVVLSEPEVKAFSNIYLVVDQHLDGRVILAKCDSAPRKFLLQLSSYIALFEAVKTESTKTLMVGCCVVEYINIQLLRSK